MTPEHTVIFWLGTALLTTGLLLKLLPVKCAHDCAACEAERVRAAGERLKATHDAWHSRDVESCVHCDDRKARRP